jgi:hypothetical protein
MHIYIFINIQEQRHGTYDTLRYDNIFHAGLIDCACVTGTESWFMEEIKYVVNLINYALP